MSGEVTVELASDLQRQAADPSGSRQVNANAGSGKTKVLVDRVSRLLLSGTDPDKILCLTYTRAAASEMQERLYKSLSNWSVAPQAELKKALGELFGCDFEAITPPLDLSEVRTLFAKALETPEGLQVMTIHAFCERIINRFPLEAGIMPGFQSLEEAETRDMLAESRTRLLKIAERDEAIGAALDHLTTRMADQTLDSLLMSAAKDFERIRLWNQSSGLNELREKFGIAANETSEQVAAKAWQDTDHARIKSIVALCTGKTKAEAAFRGAVEAAFAETDPAKSWAHYAGTFFTQSGSLKKTQIAKGVTNQDDYISSGSAEEARVEQAINRMKAAELIATNEALLRLAFTMGQDFQLAKHAARGLDFNDLILKVRDLLTRKAISSWVAYKLDGGIEHVLLDEAQDTSPEQWEIIDALTEPFAQPSPDYDGPPRTFFAVGDPKQSIYRFQNAAPAIFMESFRTREEAEEIRLRMSFRSTQQVLDVVDGVFVEQQGLQAMFDADHVPESSDLITHTAYRDDPGCVELWPIAPKAEKAEEPNEAWDTTPVDAKGEGDPRIRLAREIAGSIRESVDKGDAIYDRDKKDYRPIHAGDFLILVQGRTGGLFTALIRELKAAELPVAGADRLVLQEALIVRDLLAVTRFVLLPSDDLSLGEVLKSPLFGLNDDQLFELSVDRGEQTLWQAVQERDADLTDALLMIIKDRALPPHSFYARLLERRNPDGLSYREALFRRLGLESREALEAFLAHALSDQQHRPSSLHHFLKSFTSDEIVIKRDKDPAGQEVRVMTVHGAKGLEAPIVILPDTTRTPRKRSGGLIKTDGDGLLLAPSGKDGIPFTEAFKDADHAEEMQEYMRLLYVAMTRAETKLIVCGYHHGNGKQGFKEDTWYHWVLKTLSAMQTEAFATAFDGEGLMGLRYGSLLGNAAADGVNDNVPVVPLPKWIDQPAPKEASRSETLSPSNLLGLAHRERVPLERTPGKGRVMRGIVVHRLLEILPDHPMDRRAELAQTLLDGYSDFSDGERNAISAEVFSVLNNPDFAPVFAPGSRAEVGLVGRATSIRGGDALLTAQVDRLSVTDDTIYLVDYKSTLFVPETEADIQPAYLAQMAAYRELAREIWPGRTIRCGLLWTSVPSLMWLSDQAMDTILTEVNAVPTSV